MKGTQGCPPQGPTLGYTMQPLRGWSSLNHCPWVVCSPNGIPWGFGRVDPFNPKGVAVWLAPQRRRDGESRRSFFLIDLPTEIVSFENLQTERRRFARVMRFASPLPL
jgi:hypothetical protein